MDRIFREIREYGESMIIIDQMPSTLLDSAIANTATQITFSLKHEDDVRAAGRAMLLDSDDQLFLGKLPVGSAIVKLQNRWHAPFMLQFPFIALKTGMVSDDMISELGKKFFLTNDNHKDSKNSSGMKIGGCSAQNKPEPPPLSNSEEISPVLKRAKVGKKGKDSLLLIDIMENPLSPIRERYKRLELSAYLGDKYQNSLLSKDLIKPLTVKTEKGMIKLLDLTDKAKDKLRELGFDVSNSLRHGGIEHLYWFQQAKKKIESGGYKVHEEYPLGDGKTVDLAIIGKNKKIAVEIETGKSDAIHNIRKCLDAGFEVVSVATNEETLEKIKSRLVEFSETELQKISTKLYSS